MLTIIQAVDTHQSILHSNFANIYKSPGQFIIIDSLSSRRLHVVCCIFPFAGTKKLVRTICHSRLVFYISGANFSSFSLYINFLIFQISIVYFLRSEVSNSIRYAEFGSSIVSSKANSTSHFLHHFFSLNRDTKTTLIILCFTNPKV